MTNKEFLDAIIRSEENKHFVITMMQDPYLTRDPVWTDRIISDIKDGKVTVQLVTAALAKHQLPLSYLEIGVRRGFSMAMVLSRYDNCVVDGFDMWIPAYAGVDNPGEVFVRDEMERLHPGCIVNLHSGDSKITIPKFFTEHSGRQYDLILVDGDHSTQGTIIDARNTLPSLSRGGFLVLDDLHDNQVINAWNIILSDLSDLDDTYTSTVIDHVGIIERRMKTQDGYSQI